MPLTEEWSLSPKAKAPGLGPVGCSYRAFPCGCSGVVSCSPVAGERSPSVQQAEVLRPGTTSPLAVSSTSPSSDIIELVERQGDPPRVLLPLGNHLLADLDDFPNGFSQEHHAVAVRMDISVGASSRLRHPTWVI